MKALLYCFRVPNYYGFGVTPEDAVRKVRDAGVSATRILKGVMHELPTGIINAWVDDFGGLNWQFPETAPEELVRASGAKEYVRTAWDNWVPTDEAQDATPVSQEEVARAVVEQIEGEIACALEYLREDPRVDPKNSETREALKELKTRVMNLFEDIGL